MIRSRNFVYALLIISVTLLVVRVEATARSHQTKPSPHITAPSYQIDYESQELEAKRIQLEQRLKKLNGDQVCSKPAKPESTNNTNDTCEKLKSENQRDRIEMDLRYQNEANARMIYQSKWQTTCQSWKHEIQVLKNKTRSQQQELKHNSLKIQQMADQIAILTVKLNQANQPCPSCPACPIQKCPAGPSTPTDGHACPECQHQQCEVCAECEQCPHCRDEQYEQLQEEYTILYRKFESCEQQVQQCHNNKGQVTDCSHIEQELNEGLSQVVSTLNLSKGLKISPNLQDTIRKSSQKLSNSKQLKSSLSIVTLLLNGLITELQSDTKPCTDNKGTILQDCMSSFKKAVEKLKVCEQKLTPFIAGSNK